MHGTEYMGPVLPATLKADDVKSAAECKALCMKEYYCDVATFYNDKRACALRMIPDASPRNMLKRGTHSLRKCMPKGA